METKAYMKYWLWNKFPGLPTLINEGSLFVLCVGHLRCDACITLNIDLARAKSEALDNIYSLFKQNIKSCNAKQQRQHWRTGKKNYRFNLQKSNFALAAQFISTFLCRSFARLQHETFRNFLVTPFIEEMYLVYKYWELSTQMTVMKKSFCFCLNQSATRTMKFHYWKIIIPHVWLDEQCFSLVKSDRMASHVILGAKTGKPPFYFQDVGKVCGRQF